MKIEVIICGFILPFYIIAAGVWYIAWKMPHTRKKKNNLDKLSKDSYEGGHY